MSVSIGEVLADARRRLGAAPFEPSIREAQLLLAHVLESSEASLLAHRDEPLSADQRRRFESLLTRRLNGEPVAYILGEKEFFGRAFAVDDRVLIPRPESEHLVETALDLRLPGRPLLLDIGTGSGCLAVTLALELPTARVLAVDLSLDALCVAGQNLRRHAVEGRVDLVMSDLAAALDLQPFDLVVANPPYVGRREAVTLSIEIRKFEPHTALFAGQRGDSVHRRLLHELIGLRPGAWLVLEIGAEQEEWLRRVSRDSIFECLEVRADYAGHPRVAVLRRR